MRSLLSKYLLTCKEGSSRSSSFKNSFRWRMYEYKDCPPTPTVSRIRLTCWVSYSYISYTSMEQVKITTLWSCPRGAQRDVVYLGRPIAPSYISPNAGFGEGGLRSLSQWVQLSTWSRNKVWQSNSMFNLWSYPWNFIRPDPTYCKKRNTRGKVGGHYTCVSWLRGGGGVKGGIVNDDDSKNH